MLCKKSKVKSPQKATFQPETIFLIDMSQKVTYGLKSFVKLALPPHKREKQGKFLQNKNSFYILSYIDSQLNSFFYRNSLIKLQSNKTSKYKQTKHLCCYPNELFLMYRCISLVKTFKFVSTDFHRALFQSSLFVFVLFSSV